MAKGIKKVVEEVVEEVIEDVIEDVEEKVVIKPKRKLTEAQLENLKKGRELGKLKLKEHAQNKHNEYVEKVKVETVVKNAKKEAKVASIDELKKVADSYELRKRIDSIDDKITSFFEETYNRRKNKEKGGISKAVKEQLPVIINEAFVERKMKNEHNPYYGKV